MTSKLLILTLAFGALCACSSDAPSQGQSVSHSELSSSIDQKLDQMQKMPAPARAMAAMSLQQPIANHGTPEQKQRFAAIMQGTQSRMKPSRGG